MSWSPESRQSFFTGLDAIDRVVVAFYRVLLALLVVAILAVVGYVAMEKPFGDGSQGEYFHFAIATLIASGWVASQFMALGQRQRGTWPAVKVRSDAQAGANTWQFQFGAPSAEGNENATGGGLPFRFSRSFTVPLTSLPAEIVPDDAALALLQREVERGVSLEEACSLVQPRFREWTELQQRAYCILVQSLLEQRSQS